MCRINLTTAQKREHHLLFMIVCMVTCYLFCWLPYGLVSLITTFGKPGAISPTISIIPSILAKSSTFLNPLIYIFMNKQVRDMEAIIQWYILYLIGIFFFAIDKHLKCVHFLGFRSPAVVLLAKQFIWFPKKITTEINMYLLYSVEVDYHRSF